eukprot:GGOE01020277.1.p1 GENE.GGOE01020277.1~~GGOE01020277.1.p1  ORF type:complete len:427 (+),score=87.29 GGOE01020277.1:64-1344(+)
MTSPGLLPPSMASCVVTFRFYTGVGVGISSVMVDKYVGELVPSHQRGSLGGVAMLAVTMGTLTSYLSGLALGDIADNWRWVLGLAALPSSLTLLLQGFLPESPRWLLLCSLRRANKQWEAEARHTMVRMWAPHPHRDAWVDREMDNVRRSLLEAMPQSDGSGHSECGSVASKAPQDQIRGRLWFTLAVGSALHVLQQGVGANIVIYYGATILKEGGFADREAMLLTSGMGFIQLLMHFNTLKMVNRVGRRPLALFGITGMMVAHAFLAVSCVPTLWQNTSLTPPSITAISMLFFRVAFSLSLGPLPFMVVAEVLPLQSWSRGIETSWMAHWLANIAVCLSFPALCATLSPAAVFGLYSSVCAVAFLFVWCVVPEARRLETEAVHPRSDATSEPSPCSEECASRDTRQSDLSPASDPVAGPTTPEPL